MDGMIQPALRTGVEVSKPPGEEYWVVNAAGTSRFFRFGATEYELISLLDGRRTVAEIAEILGRRLGASVAPTAVLPILGQLASMEIVDPASLGEVAEQANPRGGRTSPNRQSIVFFKLRAINPQRLLDRAYPYVKHLLSPAALFAYLALFLVAVTLVVVNFSDISAQAALLVTDRLPETMLLIWLVNAPIIFAHEFAHAFTARRFGLPVREMGFLLIFFNPALYADVSEAWRASRKRRLWVGFAGIALNLTVGSLALILWLVLGGTPAGEALFVAAVICALGAVMNLNPLIRLDGYYLLVDLLRIPNLRTRSFQLIRDLLRRRASHLRQTTQRRELFVYLAYGIVGGLYSAALIGWSAHRLSGLLGDSLGLAGAIMGALLIPALFVMGRVLARVPLPRIRWRRSPIAPGASSAPDLP